MQTTAQGWLVLGLTDSRFALGASDERSQRLPELAIRAFSIRPNISPTVVAYQQQKKVVASA
jgi:hypothetical protein